MRNTKPQRNAFRRNKHTIQHRSKRRARNCMGVPMPQNALPPQEYAKKKKRRRHDAASFIYLSSTTAFWTGKVGGVLAMFLVPSPPPPFHRGHGIFSVVSIETIAIFGSKRETHLEPNFIFWRFQTRQALSLPRKWSKQVLRGHEVRN